MNPTDYKPTYPFEVEYMDGTKGTEDIPRMSSAIFLDAVSMLNMSGTFVEVQIANYCIKLMVPGLLEKLKPQSGIKLALKVLKVEEQNFLDLGELVAPAEEPAADGPPPTPAATSDSSSTT